MMVRVAALDVAGQETPHRYRQVVAKFCTALDELLEKFDLVDSLNARSLESSEPGQWKHRTLGECRKILGSIPEWKNWDNVDLVDELELKTRVTTCPLWLPLFSSWLEGDRVAEDYIVQKFKIRLELQADWIKQNRVVSWIEWQLGMKDQALRVHYDCETKSMTWMPIGAWD
jgi:hypothetical protein